MSSSKKVVVTIEGSVTPSVALGRGQRRTVALTDKVQRLIDRGYVVVVDRQEIKPTIKPPAPKPATPVETPAVTSSETQTSPFDNG